MKRIKLDKAAVESLFEESTQQSDILIGLYRMVFPDYDQIEELDGWPTVNVGTWVEIARRFRDFDLRHHPEVMAGGLWMNTGFSSLEAADDLKDWEVDLSTCSVRWKQDLEVAK